MDACVLYVSKCCVPIDQADVEIKRIIEVSRGRNAALNVTGALVFTGAYFAQCLEGPEAHISSLMDSIRRDPRHQDVKVVGTSPIQERHFKSWSMAYHGPSMFIEQHISRFFEMGNADTHKDAAKLLRLIKEFLKNGKSATART